MNDQSQETPSRHQIVIRLLFTLLFIPITASAISW